MEYHQGLTGLAKTLPRAQFSGVLQELQRDGDMLDCEYTEELGGVEVTITGDWDVRGATSLLSGATSIALDVTTKRVKYGFMSMIGERWKPLRAMALLDVVYVDDVSDRAVVLLQVVISSCICCSCSSVSDSFSSCGVVTVAAAAMDVCAASECAVKRSECTSLHSHSELQSV
jgi:hypothetical protein